MLILLKDNSLVHQLVIKNVDTSRMRGTNVKNIILAIQKIQFIARSSDVMKQLIVADQFNNHIAFY